MPAGTTGTPPVPAPVPAPGLTTAATPAAPAAAGPALAAGARAAGTGPTPAVVAVSGGGPVLSVPGGPAAPAAGNVTGTPNASTNTANITSYRVPSPTGLKLEATVDSDKTTLRADPQTLAKATSAQKALLADQMVMHAVTADGMKYGGKNKKTGEELPPTLELPVTSDPELMAEQEAMAKVMGLQPKIDYKAYPQYDPKNTAEGRKAAGEKAVISGPLGILFGVTKHIDKYKGGTEYQAKQAAALQRKTEIFANLTNDGVAEKNPDARKAIAQRNAYCLMHGFPAHLQASVNLDNIKAYLDGQPKYKQGIMESLKEKVPGFGRGDFTDLSQLQTTDNPPRSFYQVVRDEGMTVALQGTNYANANTITNHNCQVGNYAPQTAAGNYSNVAAMRNANTTALNNTTRPTTMGAAGNAAHAQAFTQKGPGVTAVKAKSGGGPTAP